MGAAAAPLRQLPVPGRLALSHLPRLVDGAPRAASGLRDALGRVASGAGAGAAARDVAGDSGRPRGWLLRRGRLPRAARHAADALPVRERPGEPALPVRARPGSRLAAGQVLLGVAVRLLDACRAAQVL